MANETFYVLADKQDKSLTQLPEGFSYFGTIETDSKNRPSQEMHSALLEKGCEVYLNSDDAETAYVRRSDEIEFILFVKGKN